MEELSRGLLDTSVLIAREEDSQIESSLPQEIAISVAKSGILVKRHRAGRLRSIAEQSLDMAHGLGLQQHVATD
jgi:hypothetical protein